MGHSHSNALPSGWAKCTARRQIWVSVNHPRWRVHLVFVSLVHRTVDKGFDRSSVKEMIKILFLFGRQTTSFVSINEYICETIDPAFRIRGSALPIQSIRFSTNKLVFGLERNLTFYFIEFVGTSS